VLLVETAASVAAGKALDIQQSGAVSASHTRLEGTDDITRVIGTAACIVADRHGPPAAEWEGDDGLAMMRRLLRFTGDAPLVFAGPSQAGLMLTTSREEHVSRTRFIGSSTEAYASAVRSMIALEAGCSPAEVVVAVLGVPPKGLVVPWSEVAIGGFALERVLMPVQLVRLEERAARLWPPGPYALGLAAALAAEAIVTASRRALSVLTVLDGEFGVRNRVGALPALFDARGVARAQAPSLTSRERVLLDSALAG
jgi:malate/lactate dehydrogenase